MKLDRIALLTPSLAAACFAFVGLASITGCVIPDDYCDRHPEDRNCAYATDTYRQHGGTTGSNVKRVDPTPRQIQLNGVPAREHSPARAVVEQATDLAQTPAQFAARIVGNVPQQFAQGTPGDGLRRQRHIRE